MNAYEIVRKAIPDADQGVAEFILWSRTSYPFGKVTARDIYKAARRSRRAYDNGIELCEACDNKVDEGEILCRRCGS